MEEKPAGSSATAGADSPASAEPASSRRRAGGLKRKANATSVNSSSSTPSKRLTREKAAISHPPIHNGGPLTRARQGPNNLGSSASAAAAGAGFKLEDKVALSASEAATVAALEEEISKLEKLKASIEAEFEGIRSRDSNAHVVPNHCGWFSWSKIHLLEERALPSFFNGKSQTRTPDTYMKIRNWIVKKFHANPNVQIELKDLSELEVADLDAKQEVLEFLDYWGLINFHPFPQIDSSANAYSDEAAKKDSLLEKLFHFETIQPSPLVLHKPNLSTPSVPSGLFPESSIAEDLVQPEGPAVEYHCNSCSADCSRKRYHCQKQADYDLCADCFSNRKFGSDMSSSDFILMEPADPGLSGGKWTDQETLLLLEALELYKENWNEIAEHVATKTKAQCILHFVQMPTEDAFFDCDDDVDGSSKETTDQPTIVDDASVPKDGIEISEEKTGAKEDFPLALPMEASKQEDASELKVVQETAKLGNANEAIVGEETTKSKDTSEVKAAQHLGENLAVKALTEAFQAIGYLHTPEIQLSFAEVGNPVMALAAFLARLVGSDVSTASSGCSLKSLSSDSPGMQLAARHCFLLEDPPDNQQEPAEPDCATETANQDAQNFNQEGQAQKGNNADGGELSIDNSNRKIEDSAAEEKQPLNSPSDKSTENVNTANEAGTAVSHEVEHGKLKESSDSVLQKEPQINVLKESNEMPSNSECPPSSTKETEGTSTTVPSQPKEVNKDVEMVSNSTPAENDEPCPSVASVPVEEESQTAETSKDVDMISDSLPAEKNEQQQPVKSNSVRDSTPSIEAPKDVDMLSSMTSELKEPPQPVAPNSVVENGATKAEDQKGSKRESADFKQNDDNSIDKVKRAAVSALSAAAVKAKLLANQEEDQIRQLAASLIEKQLRKLETKLAFFNEMDHVIMRVREQLDRSKQKLYHERAQIIAARLGLPASSSRGMPPQLPTNRIAMNFANSIPRPPMSMTSQRPPIARPMGTLAPTPSNTFVSTTAGSSIRPSGQDKLSSVGMK
ncbi:SWI/SNF complex subunit SWI3D isoform X2 [Jatropha curcas]|uniref:SWI/SNF complex subunit SWI3D isoform X2 n=1 Tax=Jatropha curcas TaxID=180498 RepID=UPI0005FB5B87|nr:SWI/SNF complex subunit SWI3D isoform X2 [Jatropha curcas]